MPIPVCIHPISGRIPSTPQYHIIPDPPGAKVGCGGSTVYVLRQVCIAVGSSSRTKDGIYQAKHTPYLHLTAFVSLEGLLLCSKKG